MAKKPVKMGRPPAENPKCCNAQVRFTKEEYAEVKECADRNGLTMTQLLRQGAAMIVESLK